MNKFNKFNKRVSVTYPPDNLSTAPFAAVGLMAPYRISAAINKPIATKTTNAIHSRFFSLFPLFVLTSSCGIINKKN